MKSLIVKISTTSVIILALAVLIPFLIFIKPTIQKSKAKAQKSDKLILGFSQIGSESAWRTRNTESIFEAAEANNIQVLFDDAQQKQANQLKAIRSFIVYQVDVIAFVPIVEDGWDNVLQEAKDAGIPVIIVDRHVKADHSMYAGFLGEDGIREGNKAADFLVKKCANSNNPVNIIEFSGTEHSSVTTERAYGFRSVIEKDPKFKIVHSEDGDFLTSRGKEIMNNILEINGTLTWEGQQINAIYSHNDSMTLGLLDSLHSHNIDTSNVIIISIDAEQKSIDALVNGDLNCVVECNPNLGPTLMDLVKKVVAGQKIPLVSYMNETVFTENDDFSTYEPRGY